MGFTIFLLKFHVQKVEMMRYSTHNTTFKYTQVTVAQEARASFHKSAATPTFQIQNTLTEVSVINAQFVP